MPSSAYEKCREVGCNNWIPISGGGYCYSHHTAIVPAKTIPAETSILTSTGTELKQCSYIYPTGRAKCNMLTPTTVNGQSWCRQHIEHAYTRRALTDNNQSLALITPARHWNASTSKYEVLFDDSAPKDPDDDEVEWIDWSMYDNSFKQGKYSTVNTIHFKFRLKGTEGQKNVFHAMLKKADSDYPLDPDRKRTTPLRFCQKCHAWEWPRSVPDPDEVRRAAKQAGIKQIKIQRWINASKCQGVIIQKTESTAEGATA